MEDRYSAISGVAVLRLPNNGLGDCVVFKKASSGDQLYLFNLHSDKIKEFSGVKNFVLDQFGNSLVLIKTVEGKDENRKLEVLWVNCRTTDVKEVWAGEEVGSNSLTIRACCFDGRGEQFAFVVEHQSDREFAYSLLNYNEPTSIARVLVADFSHELDTTTALFDPNILQFSRNGRWLFFRINEKTNLNISSALAKVDIWSYKDIEIQPRQQRAIENGELSYMAAVRFDGHKVIRLENSRQELLSYPPLITGDYVVVADRYSDSWLRPALPHKKYLMSLLDGSQAVLSNGERSLSNFSFSPMGKFLVYYNSEAGAYFSYDIVHKVSRNITELVTEHVDHDLNETAGSPGPAGPVAAWRDDDEYLMLYGKNNIWEVSSENKGAPRLIASYFDNGHIVKTRVASEANGVDDPNSRVYRGYNSHSKMVLTLFDPRTKRNGLCLLKLDSLGRSLQCSLGPYTFYHLASQLSHDDELDRGMAPIKAIDSNIWIVKRQSAKEAPNYFVTSDFKEYIQVSDLRPQEKYNWVTTELLTWRLPDGTLNQGILYKPENFDSTKKYPVIFNYYRALTFRMYEFPVPEFTQDNINIPWFVSRGYLVFSPDIHYHYSDVKRSGNSTGNCALNAIISGAHYLEKLPYIEYMRMAIQGHSFGGGETNYVLFHTHLFVAAAEAAGDTDPISAYLTLVPLASSIENTSKQAGFDLAYGGDPWEKTSEYLNSSAVLHANKIVTPLLIMHNRMDNQIQWRQGLELYMALRRLGRRVWLLQYDNGGHSVRGLDAQDYTIRLTQFFDYYLKGEPPALWMTIGVPAKLKGVSTGFELDKSGRIP